MTQNLLENRLTQAEALYVQGKLLEAELLYRQAIVENPLCGEAMTNLGVVLTESSRPDEAAAAWRHALLIDPKLVAAWVNLANCSTSLNQYLDAEAFSAHALSLSPHCADALNTLARTWYSQGKLPEALSAYRTGLAIAPRHASCLYNKSLIDLTTGHLDEGWQGYEARWDSVQKNMRIATSRPAWAGEKLTGKTLLIAAEQGFGDSIQFVRYATMAVGEAKEVIVCAPPALVRLFRGIPNIRFVSKYPGDSEYDFYCPTLSLPKQFKTTLATIPADIPYLSAPEYALRLWRNWFEHRAANNYPRIGLVWAGRSTHTNDANRSMQFEQLTPLLATEGICWVNLQRERIPENIDVLTERLCWLDPMPEAEDFADTAAIIEQLDLAICVDTSVAHLAGALGKPVWVLVANPCDWRWTLTHPDSSPWYPSMRLFRQSESGQWGELIDEVGKALHDFLVGKSFSPQAPLPPLVLEVVKYKRPNPPPKNHSSPEHARWRREIVKHPYWQHRIALPGGIETPGWAPLSISPYDIPERLDGLRVLDVGASDGYWTFEALKRGAREVVAIDDFSDTMGLPRKLAGKPWGTFDLCRQALGHNDANCKRITMSVYDVSEEVLGTFDLVLLFGVIHQLRHPLLALEKISSVCTDTLLVESPILDDYSPNRGGLDHGYPKSEMVMEFCPNSEFGNNPANWWIPTLQTLAMMVHSIGFPEIDGWKQNEAPTRSSQCRGHVKASRSRG